MARKPCCSQVGLKRGTWTHQEDMLLTDYVQKNGEGNWKYLPKNAGLLRCGKSCRLRWMNYLKPDIKRGDISPEEDDLIIKLHALLGNRWSIIAKRLPGRTDNEIKNYWNTLLVKKIGNQKRIAATKRTETRKHDKKETKKHGTKKAVVKKSGNEGFSTKLYFPRPHRFLPASVVPRSCSFSIMAGGDEIAPICAQDSDLVNDRNDFWGSPAPEKENMLEMTYDGNVQLLTLDSFDDSIFDIQLDSFVDSIFN